MNDVEPLAVLLGIEIYHADDVLKGVPNEERSRALGRWMRERSAILCCHVKGDLNMHVTAVSARQADKRAAIIMEISDAQGDREDVHHVTDETRAKHVRPGARVASV